jgi:hypothetical protein
MQIDDIEKEQNLIQRQINIEESVDYRVDYEYVRELWSKWHNLQKLKTFLQQNQEDKIIS